MRRLGAFVIDNFSWFFIGAIVLKLLTLNEVPIAEIKKIMLPFGFWILFKDFNGQGIGKYFLGLKIVYKNNPADSPPFHLLVARNLLLAIPFMEMLALLLSSDGQRLGDKMIKTIVIKTNSDEH